MTRFAKLALSGLTALSLTLAPLPAAAAPDGEDVLKTLAGLAVLGIIANELNDRDRKRTTRRSSSTRVYDPYRSIEGHRSPRVIEGEIRRPGGNKGNKHGVRKARLPDRCLRIVETSRGDRLVYGQRCLSRNYKHARHLPDRCRVTVRTENRIRPAYGARCLARDGWRVAGR